MGGKSFDQFYKELIVESQQRALTVEDALVMAWKAGLEYGVQGGKVEDVEKADEADPPDNEASRLLRSTLDDPRLP